MGSKGIVRPPPACGAAAGRHRRHHRVSLTPLPAGTALRKSSCPEILQTMGLRAFGRWSWRFRAAAVPPAATFRSCARIQSHIRLRMRTGGGVRRGGDMTVAVMGCVVNGRREQAANIGISLPAPASAGGAGVRGRREDPSPSRASASPRVPGTRRAVRGRRYARSVTHERARRTQVQALRGAPRR